MNRCRLLLLALLLGPALLRAGPGSFPQVDRLKAEVDRFVGAQTGDQRLRYKQEINPMLQAALTQLRLDLATDNFSSTDQSLRQIRAQAPDPAVEQLVDELLAANKAARDKRDGPLIARVDALVKRTGELCLRAREPKEFDGLLAELTEAQTNLGRSLSTDVLQRAAQRSNAAIQYARRWQDYLMKLNAGNATAAAQIMNELSNRNLHPVVPRSELVKRANPPAPKKP